MIWFWVLRLSVDFIVLKQVQERKLRKFKLPSCKKYQVLSKKRPFQNENFLQIVHVAFTLFQNYRKCIQLFTRYYKNFPSCMTEFSRFFLKIGCLHACNLQNLNAFLSREYNTWLRLSISIIGLLLKEPFNRIIQNWKKLQNLCQDVFNWK